MKASGNTFSCIIIAAFSCYQASGRSAQRNTPLMHGLLFQILSLLMQSKHRQCGMNRPFFTRRFTILSQHFFRQFGKKDSPCTRIITRNSPCPAAQVCQLSSDCPFIS